MTGLIRIIIDEIKENSQGLKTFTGRGRSGEKFTDWPVIGQFGLSSRVKKGAQGLVASFLGLAWLIGSDDPTLRPEIGEDGPWSLIYSDKDNYILLDKDKNIKLVCGKDTTVTAIGKVTINAAQVNVTAAQVNLSDETVLKKLLTEDFAAQVHDLHTHPGVQTGSGSTAPPTPSAGAGQTTKTKAG